MTELAVVLDNPKYAHNVGGVLRACSVYGAGLLRWSGERVIPEQMSRLPREERMKAYRDVDSGRTPTPLSDITGRGPSRRWVVVCVELVPGAEQLPDFIHPLNPTVYVFGPEDGTVRKGLRTMSHRFVMIPTAACMNLSAAVNVVLYDRYVKRRHAGLESILPSDEYTGGWHGGEQWPA